MDIWDISCSLKINKTNEESLDVNYIPNGTNRHVKKISPYSSSITCILFYHAQIILQQISEVTTQVLANGRRLKSYQYLVLPQQYETRNQKPKKIHKCVEIKQHAPELPMGQRSKKRNYKYLETNENKNISKHMLYRKNSSKSKVDTYV